MESNRQKEISTVIGVSFATILVFLALGLTTNDPQAFGSLFGAFTAGIAILWAAIVACTYAFFYEWRNGRYIVTGVAMISAAWAGLFSVPAIVGALLLGGFLGSASQMITSAVHERMVFRLRLTVLPGLRVILAGLAVTVIALLLPLVRQEIGSGNVFIPDNLVSLVLQPATPILENLIEGYAANSTVNQLIDAQIQKQLAELPEGTQVPPGQRDQVREELSRNVGVQIQGNETVADVLTSYGNAYVKGLAGKSGITVTVILVVVGLLAIRALVPFLAWIALILAIALFFLARKTKLVSVQQTQMPVDRLRF